MFRADIWTTTSLLVSFYHISGFMAFITLTQWKIVVLHITCGRCYFKSILICVCDSVVIWNKDFFLLLASSWTINKTCGENDCLTWFQPSHFIKLGIMTLNMTHSSMVSVVCEDHICLLGTKHCYQGLKCPGDAKLSLNKRLNSLLIAFFCKEKTNWEIIHVLHQLLVLSRQCGASISPALQSAARSEDMQPFKIVDAS